MSSGSNDAFQDTRKERWSFALTVIGTLASVIGVVLGLVAIRETMDRRVILSFVAIAIALISLYFARRLAKQVNAPRRVFAAGVIATLAVIGVIAVVLSGLMGGKFLGGGVGTTGAVADPTSRSSESGYSTTTLQSETPPQPMTVSLDRPDPMSDVPLLGTTVAGTVSGAVPENHSLWLFILSPDDGGIHYLTDRIAPVSGGVWSLGTGQVGSDDESEVGKTFIVQAVLADAAASAVFEQAIAENNWEGWQELPEGAAVEAELPLVRE